MGIGQGEKHVELKITVGHSQDLNKASKSLSKLPFSNIRCLTNSETLFIAMLMNVCQVRRKFCKGVDDDHGWIFGVYKHYSHAHQGPKVKAICTLLSLGNIYNRFRSVATSFRIYNTLVFYFMF